MIPTWGAAFGANAIFNSAEFRADLTHSAVPDKAAPGTTATFTRATTATVQNNDGYLVTALAGEARFEGARRVRNLLTFTEALDNAAWTKINGGAGSAPTVTSGFTAPDGTATAWRLQANRGGNAGGDYSIVRQAHTSGNCRAIYAKSNTASTQEIYFGAANGPADKVSVTTEWTRVSNPNVANNLTDIGSYGATGNATQSIDILIWHPQCEDVTAQTTQTAGEYVSVGALDYRSELNRLYLSLPGTNGHCATTPDSVVASPTGDIELIFDGAATDWTPTADQVLICKDDAGVQRDILLFLRSATVRVELWTSATGASYAGRAASATAALPFADGQRGQIKVTRSAATGDTNFYTSTDGATWTQLGTTVSTTAGAIHDGTAALTIGALGDASKTVAFGGKVYSATLASSIGGAPVVDFNPHRDATTPTGTFTSSTTGEVWTINGASSVVRNAAYHGSFVDGVKCFPTDLAGNPLPTNYTYDAVSLNGVAGAYVSTPDSVAASVTGDIDIRVKAELVDWTPAADTRLVCKRNATTAYDNYIKATTGLLGFYDGAIEFVSTVAPVVVDGSILWCRVTADVDNGAGSKTVTFYTSADGTSWTQLGNVVTAGTAGNLSDTTDAVTLGIFGNGTSGQLSGRIYQAQIYNGINGTLAVDFDASRYAGGTTLTGSTGETWTLQGNAVIHPTNSPMLGYSAEGARTNLCLQSNAFTTTWTAAGTGTTTQNAIGPDGATSAWTLTDSDAAGIYSITQAITLTAATYTFSVFVKKTTGAQSSYPSMSVYDNVSKTAAVTIDTTNGVATVWTAYTGLTVVTSSATCVSHNDSFWRVSLTFLATATGWNVYMQAAGTTNATQSTGTFSNAVTGSAVFYGAQVELGSFATSHIPTTTTAVTRNADVLTYPSAGNISGTVGWAYAEVVSQWSDTAPGRIAIGVSAATNSPMTFYGLVPTAVGYFDGANASAKTGLSSIATGVRKRASTWGGSTVLVGGDGVVPASGTFDGDFNIGASFAVGSTTTGAENFFGTIRDVRIGQRQLSASEMQAITS